MISKKVYIRPDIIRIMLDSTVSLMMQSGPADPPPRSGGSKGTNEPFQSPFGDKPFG